MQPQAVLGLPAEGVVAWLRRLGEQLVLPFRFTVRPAVTMLTTIVSSVAAKLSRIAAVAAPQAVTTG
jgi:hypothetical protein